MAEAFANESNYTVWSDLSVNLSVVSVILQYTDFYDSYKAYIRKLFSAVTQKAGWDPKPQEGASPFL